MQLYPEVQRRAREEIDRVKLEKTDLPQSPISPLESSLHQDGHQGMVVMESGCPTGYQLYLVVGRAR